MTNCPNSGFAAALDRGLRQLGRSQPLLGQGVTGTLLPQRRNKMTNCPHSGFAAALDRGLPQLGRSQPLLGQGITGALLLQRHNKMTNGAHFLVQGRSKFLSSLRWPECGHNSRPHVFLEILHKT